MLRFDTERPTLDDVAWPDVLSTLDASIGLDLGFEESRFDSDLEGCSARCASRASSPIAASISPG